MLGNFPRADEKKGALKCHSGLPNVFPAFRRHGNLKPKNTKVGHELRQTLDPRAPSPPQLSVPLEYPLFALLEFVARGWAPFQRGPQGLKPLK